MLAKKWTRSWGMKSKPPVALGRKDKCVHHPGADPWLQIRGEVKRGQFYDRCTVSNEVIFTLFNW